MAIVKCAACEAKVNAEAVACPQCGADPRTGEWIPSTPESIRAVAAMGPPPAPPGPRARSLARSRSLLKTHAGIYLALGVLAAFVLVVGIATDEPEFVGAGAVYTTLFGAAAVVLLATKPWRQRDLTRYRWLIFLTVLDTLIAVDYLAGGVIVRGLGFAALAAYSGIAVADLRRLHGGAPGLTDAVAEDAPVWTPDAAAPAAPVATTPTPSSPTTDDA